MARGAIIGMNTVAGNIPLQSHVSMGSSLGGYSQVLLQAFHTEKMVARGNGNIRDGLQPPKVVDS
jgi:hypothetical protein